MEMKTRVVLGKLSIVDMAGVPDIGAEVWMVVSTWRALYATKVWEAILRD